MSSEKDKPGIIPQNEYQPELEAKVRLETARISLLPIERIERKIHRTVVPKFGTDLRAERDFWAEELRRCIHGHDGLPGRYYMFFNHCFIKDKDKRRGRIQPDVRAIDIAWFKFLETVEKDPGRGVVCVKRRQVGMSWKAALDMLHCCQFNHEYMVGANSKTESDGHDLLAKVKYLHRNLPPQLRSAVVSDRRDLLSFRSTGSTIKIKAPVDNAHASEQYSKLIVDESGELVNLANIIAMAEPCLESSPGIRVSPPIYFGTVGDILKGGQTLMDLWYNNELYNLSRFAFWGYNACIMDDRGNDLIEDSVRWILYSRKKKESGSQKLYHKFIQNYPLHEGDAFLTSEASGVGNPITINERLVQLAETPPIVKVGWMRPKGAAAEFFPDPNGKIEIYQDPDPSRKVVASLDPAEDDDVAKSRDTSDLAAALHFAPYGHQPPTIAAELCDRPKKLDDYYRQLALLLILYGAKLDIELNKGGWRALKWFETHFPHLVALAPQPPTAVKLGSVPKYGVKMTPERKIQMRDLLEEHLENYIDYVNSVKFLKQCLVFGSNHADDDLAVAWGWNLIRLQSQIRTDRLREQTEEVRGGTKLAVIDGRLQWGQPRVTKDLTTDTRSKPSKSQLFSF